MSGIPEGWSDQNVLVTLETTEPAAFIQYRIDSGGWIKYYDPAPGDPYDPEPAPPIGPNPFTISKDGITRIDFYSTMRHWLNGSLHYHTEDPPKTVYVRIDKSAPTVTSDAKSIYADSATVKFTAADAGSGVAELELRLDSETTSTYTFSPAVPSVTKSVSTSVLGAHEVSYRAVDELGKVRTGTVSFTVDEGPIFGAGRYETAVELSKAGFATDGSVSNIVVASGMGFADALSASGLAGAVESPILLVPSSGTVPTAVKAEVARIAAPGATVWVIGGKAVVPDAVANQLKVGSVTSIKRLAGTSRYQTSAAVAAKVKEVLGSGFEGVAFVASGANFPDALAASPVAWAKGFPVLLTEPTRLTAATAGAITANGITDCIIAGGPGAVSDTTKNAVDGLAGVAVERWYGGPNTGRYETATKVATNAKARGWASLGYVGVASGENFPDALAGGPLAGSKGGVMVLTQAKTLPKATSSFLSANKGEIDTAQPYGGPSAVSNDVYVAIGNALQ